MLLTLDHETTYQYSEAQKLVVQSHRLYPADCDHQKVLDWRVKCEKAEFGQYFTDGAGDRLRTMTVRDVGQELTIRVTGSVETIKADGVIQFNNAPINPLVYNRITGLTKPSAAMRDAALSMTEKTLLDRGYQIMEAVRAQVEYQAGESDTGTSAAESWEQGAGVCQDQTHCMLALSRVAGIPARYATGYLVADAEGDEHNATHAWAELFIDGLGWVGFDATNNCCPDQKYIRIGSGLDAADAALMRGISRGTGSESLHTLVKINQQ